MCISPPLCYKTSLSHQLSSHKPLLTPGGSWEEGSIWFPCLPIGIELHGSSRRTAEKLGTELLKTPTETSTSQYQGKRFFQSRSPPWWQPRWNLPVHTDRKRPQVYSHVCEGSQRLIAASFLPGWTAATSWSRSRGWKAESGHHHAPAEHNCH